LREGTVGNRPFLSCFGLLKSRILTSVLIWNNSERLEAIFFPNGKPTFAPAVNREQIKMKKIRSELFTRRLTACVLCFMTFNCCRQPPAEVRKSEYEMMTVSLSDKKLSGYYSASIRGKQDVEIRPQIAGMITEICVKEGAVVHKGEPLFIIDQVACRAALQIAMASVKAAEANVATAQLTVESKQELFDQDVVSSFELQTAENVLRSQQAALALAKAQEVNAQNDLSYTIVKSPSNGIAGMIPYREGSLVSPNIAVPLTSVSDNSEIYAYFSMTENQMLALARQQGSLHDAISNMPSVELLLSDGSTYSEKGKIDAISGIIEQSTGAISLRATFPNRDGMLHSGGSANIIFPYTLHDCMVIPQSATFEIQDKKYIYKVENGVAVSKPVRAFSINDGKEFVIEEGIQPGDVIIVEGAGLLREGTPVVAKNNI
jgi:membrane fusion protein (multidrug efflux system)